MSGVALIQVGATLLCTHAGTVSIVTSNTRVKASGQFLARVNDQFLIAGCPFNTGGSPMPCLTGKFMSTAMRVKVDGQPLLLQTSTGVGLNAANAPQGPLNIAATQPRVKGL